MNDHAPRAHDHKNEIHNLALLRAPLRRGGLHSRRLRYLSTIAGSILCAIALRVFSAPSGVSEPPPPADQPTVHKYLVSAAAEYAGAVQTISRAEMNVPFDSLDAALQRQIVFRISSSVYYGRISTFVSGSSVVLQNSGTLPVLDGPVTDLTVADLTDTSTAALQHFLDSLAARRDSLSRLPRPAEGFPSDSTRPRKDLAVQAPEDSARSFADSTFTPIDTTYVVYLDSTERTAQFVHRRADVPAVDIFPHPNYSLYLDVNSPAYKREVQLDTTGQVVTIHETVNGLDVKVPVTVPLDEYIRLRYEFEKQNNWRSFAQAYTYRENRDQLGGILGSITNIDIPVPANPLFSIFGKNIISLKISGGVDIRFGFRRSSSDQVTLSSVDQVRNEPDFNQEVRINVDGTIGDKLKLNADWNTERTFEYENQLKIKYTGYEDEIIQSIEAGNVSLQTPALVGGGQALFGIKALMQAGPLKLTTLVSQKKGQTKEISLTGGAQQGNVKITADAYSTQHYFVDTLYRQFWEPLHRSAVRNLTADLQRNEIILSSVEVWKSFQSSNANELATARRGFANIDLPPRGPGEQYPANIETTLSRGPGKFHEGYFIKLDRLKDYKIDPIAGYITLLTTVQDIDAIAITYQTVGNDIVGGTIDDLVYGNTADTGKIVLRLIKPPYLQNRPDFKPAWELMLKNIYPLGGRDLKQEGFDLKAFYEVNGSADQDQLFGRPLLQILGLDRFDANNGAQPDNSFDFIRGLTVDPERAEIIFPTLEPFDDGLRSFFANQGITEAGIDSIVFSDVYDTTQQAARNNALRNHFVLKVTFSSAQSSRYSLGFNVVEGSVQVLLNGSPLAQGTDYTVDYIVGEVIIRRAEALLPGANVQVKYEQNDLFQLASKTLIGARGELSLFPNTNLGFTAMNLNQATLSDKVRLGDEPTNNLIVGTDLSTSFNLPFLTDVIDALPGLRTREMSSLRFTGEAAYILPDPNTKKSTVASDNGASIAYIDDFEGARRNIPFPISYAAWSLASPPEDARLGSSPLLRSYSKAKLNWYNRLPSDITTREIWPNRNSRVGQDQVTVLNLDYDPGRRGAYNFSPSLAQSLHRGNPDSIRNNWGGIMRYIGSSAGSVLEQNMNYLEIWLKVAISDSADLRRGRLYVDLGRINEDVITNRALNSEDLIATNSNPQGIPNGILNPDEEDLGIDMENDAREQTSHAAFLSSNAGDPDVDPNDPSADRWTFDNSRLDFNKINGTEGNARGADGRLPNTEDLNNNGNVDLDDQYLQYTIPLDTTYLSDTTGFESRNAYIVGGGSNGWFQFRVPLLEPSRIVGGASSPQALLQNVQYVRLWLSGFNQPVSIRIAEVGLVGNQWEERIKGDSVLKVTVVNVEDNPTYESPPGVERELDRTQPDKPIRGNEQSLSLLIRGLERGQSRQAVRKLVSRPLDLFNYKSMKMFVHGDPLFTYVGTDRYDAEIFVRFGADSLNFYEYRAPVRPGWDPLNEINISFAELTSVKAGRDSANQLFRIPAATGPPGSFYAVQGNPSLRQVKEIVVGITNPSVGQYQQLTGEVWVNELRLVDVDNSAGLAYRLDTQVKLADFGQVGFNYAQTDPNFHSLTERFGSRNTQINWAMNASFALDRFFPQNWQGTRIPVSYSHQENMSKPKYLPNTDIVVEEAADLAGERGDSVGTPALTLRDEVVKRSQTRRVQDAYSINGLQIAFPTQWWLIKDTWNKLTWTFTYNRATDRDPSIAMRRLWQWNFRVGYGVSITPNYSIQPFKSLFSGIFFLSEFADWKLHYMPITSVSGGVTAQRGRTIEIARATTNLPRDTRSFGASRSIGFDWRLIEGGPLPLSGNYNLATERNLQYFDNDSVGRGFASILQSIFFRGSDSRYSQRMTFNTKPRIPNMFEVTKYVDMNAGYGVNYSWQNAFQQGDIGKSSGWDNTINLSLGVRLKAIFDPLFAEKEEPKAAKPSPRNKRPEDREDVTKSDSTKPDDSKEQQGGNAQNIVNGLKSLGKVLIKIPFLDYENVSISFQQANRSVNSGVVGSTGFRNFWGKFPFQGSSIEDGPSRLYQLGLISDPSGRLQYSPSSSFPFIGWRTVRGRRAASASLNDQFSQSNSINLKTNRPLWTGATMDLTWKVGWQFNKNTSVLTDAVGTPTPGTVTTSGNIERSFFTLPPVLFFKVFKSNLEDVGKKYALMVDEGRPEDEALAESFEKGLEALPFLNKVFGQFVPRPNWTVRWDGIEKLGGLNSFFERLSLEHAYTSGFRRDFRGKPAGGEQTDAERVNYGFSPLASINMTFKQFLKGNLSGNFRYNTTTSYDLNIAAKNIVETGSQEMSLTLTYTRRGFSFPLFGLNLSNDFDMSLTFSRSKNSRRQYQPQYLVSNPEGTPMDGSTRTTIEPRIQYVLSSRVRAALFYRYNKIAPDEGGSLIFGTTTNEAGVDIHITI